MDRRTLIAVTLSVAIYVTWFAIFPPVPPPEVPEAPVAEATAPAEVLTSGSAAPTPVSADAEVPVQLCNTGSVLHTADGTLSSLTLLDQEARYQVQPLWSWALGGFSGPWKPYGDPPPLAQLLSPQAAGLAVGVGPVDRPAPAVEVVESAPGRLVTRARTPEGVVIERTLRAEGEGATCRVRAEVTWRNEGAASVAGGTWVGMHDVLRVGEGGYDVPMRPRVLVEGSVEGVDEADEVEGVLAAEGKPGWFGLTDTYFAVALVPQSTEGQRAVFSHVARPGAQQATGVHLVQPDALQPGQSRTASFVLYAGPKQLDALAAVDPSLTEAVQLGFFSAFGWPLLWLLRFIHRYVQDWGLSIVALTFLVKAVFFPLTQRGFRSGQAMSALQPEMAALRERFKSNPEELNRRTIELFQKNGVNPLGGCLPMLVQMPVWFALFTVLQNATELYHTEFLYLLDLSATDPYLLSPALVAGLMIVQQRLTPMQNLDETQQQMMKIMPVIFSIFFFLLPAGLVVYTFVNMVLSILQQWYIKRTFQVVPTPAAGSSGAKVP